MDKTKKWKIQFICNKIHIQLQKNGNRTWQLEIKIIKINNNITLQEETTKVYSVNK